MQDGRRRVQRREKGTGGYYVMWDFRCLFLFRDEKQSQFYKERHLSPPSTRCASSSHCPPLRRRRRCCWPSRYRRSLSVSNLHPPDNASKKWVVCSLQVSTMKPRPVSIVVVCILSTWFEFCAVGSEGHLYWILQLPHVHIRLEGHH